MAHRVAELVREAAMREGWAWSLTAPRPLASIQVTAFALILVFAWSLVGLYSLHASLPPNALTLPLEDAVRVGEVLPQGWGFFTRNPREEDVLPYLRGADGAWEPQHTAPLASLATWWGISRTGRGSGIELGMIMNVPAESSWIRCRVDESAASCLERTRATKTVHNRYPDPALCGAVGLVALRPVPWAWSDNVDSDIPRRAAQVNVEC